MKSSLLRCILLACLLAVVVGGCVWHRPIEIDVPLEVARPARPAVLLFVDGLAPEVVDRMRAEGRLPNFDRHLFARGVSVERAVTVVPSITFAASVSLVTGQYPGRHNIPGNRWFDRRRMELHDYDDPIEYQRVIDDFTAPTLFEMVPDLHTVSVLFPPHRGATRHFANWMSTGVTWFFCTMHEVDALTTYRLKAIGREAQATGRWPDLLWLYFLGPDVIGYQFSKHSPQYEATLCNLDRQIGRVAEVLTQVGVYDQTLLVLVSDHGHVRTEPTRHVDLRKIFAEMGMDVAYHARKNESESQRMRRFSRYRVVMHDEGDRRAVLHLRADDHWAPRPTLAQIEQFHRQFGAPGVCHDPAPFWEVLLARMPHRKLAAVRDGDSRVLLSDGAGRAIVEREKVADGGSPDSRYRYVVIDGADPLGLAEHAPAKPLLDGRFHTSQQWLLATCDSDAPDVVAQIVDYFDAPRSGDMMLFSTDAWQFEPHYVGGHGSITPQDMHVPMVFAGAGLPAGGQIKTARLVDVVPTLLEYLGRADAPPCRIDGVSRWPQIQAAPPASAPAEPIRPN